MKHKLKDKRKESKQVSFPLSGLSEPGFWVGEKYSEQFGPEILQGF